MDYNTSLKDTLPMWDEQLFKVWYRTNNYAFRVYKRAES